ncbi:addiction module antitoxin, RelB/DinJ family, partial [Peptoniphilus lacrimalis 315-B]
IRKNGIPFDLKLNVPNDETLKAIKEARKIAKDKNVQSYDSIEELRKDLEI